MMRTRDIFDFNIHSHFNPDEITTILDIRTKYGDNGLRGIDPKLYKKYNDFKKDCEKYKELVF